MDYQEVIELLKSANRSNDMVGILPKSDISKIIISAMQELREYKQLGDLEEVRDAVERQQEKQVINISIGDKLRFGKCPICNRRISTVEGGNYCQNCGQRLKKYMLKNMFPE